MRRSSLNSSSSESWAKPLHALDFRQDAVGNRRARFGQIVGGEMLREQGSGSARPFLLFAGEQVHEVEDRVAQISSGPISSVSAAEPLRISAMMHRRKRAAARGPGLRRAASPMSATSAKVFRPSLWLERYCAMRSIQQIGAVRIARELLRRLAEAAGCTSERIAALVAIDAMHGLGREIVQALDDLLHGRRVDEACATAIFWIACWNSVPVASSFSSMSARWMSSVTVICGAREVGQQPRHRRARVIGIKIVRLEAGKRMRHVFGRRLPSSCCVWPSSKIFSDR